MLSKLNTMIFKLKPLLCVTFGLYAFIASYPGSFSPSYSHAEQQVDCKTWSDAQKVISWTGGCVNGLLDGDGELVFESNFNEKKYDFKLVGNFNEGRKLGLYFLHNLTEGKGLLISTYDDLELFADPLKMNDDILQSRWMDEQNKSVLISFDDAWAIAEASAKKANVKSIDPKILKEYLLGKYTFTKAVSETSSNSSGLESKPNGTDDPKVSGEASSPKSSESK